MKRLMLCCVVFCLSCASAGAAVIYCAGDSRMVYSGSTVTCLLERLNASSAATFLPVYSADVADKFSGSGLWRWWLNSNACDYSNPALAGKFSCFQDASADYLLVQIAYNDLCSVGSPVDADIEYFSLVVFFTQVQRLGIKVILLTDYPGNTTDDASHWGPLPSSPSKQTSTQQNYNENYAYLLSLLRGQGTGVPIIDWWTEIYTNYNDYYAAANYNAFFDAHQVTGIHMNEAFYGYEYEYLMEQLALILAADGSALYGATEAFGETGLQ